MTRVPRPVSGAPAASSCGRPKEKRMSGLNTAMDTSLSALFAAQVGMSTTGHNIANANTVGYSRQQMMTLWSKTE